MKKVRLIGDHSSYHCGSAAAFSALRAACLKGGALVGSGEAFDVLVVNGEGSMHHDSVSCLRKLTEIETALNDGKLVELVNTVWQSNSKRSSEILRACRVTVREVLSHDELEKVGVRSVVALDQSYYHPIDEHAPIVDFRGGPVLTDFYSRDLNTFAKITTQWTRDVPYAQLHEWDWSSLVRSLSSASVLLTGRHHAVYAACRARTPFLAMKGNTHKIEGLIATSGINVPVYDDYPSLLKAFRAKAWLEVDYPSLFRWMDTQRPWELTV